MPMGLPATWLPACSLHSLKLLRRCLIRFPSGQTTVTLPGKSLSPLQQQSAGAKLVDGQSAPAKRAASAAEIHPDTPQISCRYFPSSIVPFSFRSCGRSFSLSFSSAYLYRDAIVLSGAPGPPLLPPASSRSRLASLPLRAVLQAVPPAPFRAPAPTLDSPSD